MPGPFFTRPNFEDRQIVQYSGSSITLSGNTNIYPTGNFRIYKNAFPGLVATSLDADGTVGWGPISGISWSVSACTSPLYVNNLVSCPSSGGTIQVDAGNLALNSELNFLITLSAGTTTDNVLVIDSSGYVKSVPQASITPIFTGGTGNCVTDLYVTNIHGCSPIYIQPVSPDDVYLVNGGGNVGINVLTATTKLHVSGNTLFNADVLWLSNNNTTILPTPTFKGVVVDQYFDAGGALVLAGIFTQNTSPSGNTGILMSNDTGVFGYVSVPGSLDYRTGNPATGEEFYRNKMIIKALSPSEGMVFNPSSGNADSTFWWEMDGRSLMVLKGDGIDKGFLGLALNPDGTEMPTANLQIGGTGTTGTFKYRDGNQASGYVLTSDSDGNATWQPSAGGTFTGNTSASCVTDLWVTNVYGCSPITVHDDIAFVTNKAITTNNGGGQIDLDFGGTANKVIITNDNGAFGKETLWMEDDFLALYAGSSDMLIELDNVSAEKGIGIRTQNVANSYIRLGTGTALDTILTYDNTTTQALSSVFNKPAVLIGTKSSTVLSGVTNSVIIGGIGLSAATSNTAYVPDLAIKKYSATPTTSGDTVGEVGSVTWDNNYFYVKTNTGWGRVSLDYGF